MYKRLFSILPSILISGCAMTEFSDEPLVEPVVNTQVALVPSQSTRMNQDSYGWQQIKTKQTASNMNVNHYVRGVMQDLLSNLQYVNNTTPLAVSSFVYLDSDFKQSSLLGRQLSEAFMHEVHKLGIPVIDYKLTNYIRVTPDGDFALTKDFLELEGELPIRYILTGTLLNYKDGVIVNARIIGAESKAVVASAQGEIPNSVAQGIYASQNNDGIFN